LPPTPLESENDEEEEEVVPGPKNSLHGRSGSSVKIRVNFINTSIDNNISGVSIFYRQIKTTVKNMNTLKKQ
jgi:hypothetical protein